MLAVSAKITIPFAYPFRIFFLSAGVSALCLIPLWLAVLVGDVALRVAPHWHPHELLGAFVNSAIAGFLLTAVCAWTGTRPVSGWPLCTLWLVWLAGRLVMLSGTVHAAAVLIELAFLPAVALLAARPIIAERQWRQAPVLAAIGLLWLCELAFHLSGDGRWLRTEILFAGVLILIIGGRITPGFSRGWLQRHGHGEEAATVITYSWLDSLTIVSALLLAIAEAGHTPPSLLTACIAFTAACSAIVRLLLCNRPATTP